MLSIQNMSYGTFNCFKTYRNTRSLSTNPTNTQKHTILLSQESMLNIPLVSVQCSSSAKEVCFVSVDTKLSLLNISKLGICVEALTYKQSSVTIFHEL